MNTKAQTFSDAQAHVNKTMLVAYVQRVSNQTFNNKDSVNNIWPVFILNIRHPVYILYRSCDDRMECVCDAKAFGPNSWSPGVDASEFLSSWAEGGEDFTPLWHTQTNQLSNTLRQTNTEGSGYHPRTYNRRLIWCFSRVRLEPFFLSLSFMSFTARLCIYHSLHLPTWFELSSDWLPLIK